MIRTNTRLFYGTLMTAALRGEAPVWPGYPRESIVENGMGDGAHGGYGSPHFDGEGYGDGKPGLGDGNGHGDSEQADKGDGYGDGDEIVFRNKDL